MTDDGFRLRLLLIHVAPRRRLLWQGGTLREQGVALGLRTVTLLRWGCQCGGGGQ